MFQETDIDENKGGKNFDRLHGPTQLEVLALIKMGSASPAAIEEQLLTIHKMADADGISQTIVTAAIAWAERENQLPGGGRAYQRIKQFSQHDALRP